MLAMVLMATLGAQAAIQDGGGLKAKAEALVIPEIHFRETSLSSAVEYLRQLSAKEPDGQGAFNFVELYPQEYGEDTLVTMSLNNIPLAAALKYLSESAGLEVEYQQYAVVLKKAAVVGAAPQ